MEEAFLFALNIFILSLIKRRDYYGKKPNYSQGQYVVRKRSTSNTTGKKSPWSYFSDVFDDLEKAQEFAEDEANNAPHGVYAYEVDVIDYEGNLVGGAVYEDG